MKSKVLSLFVAICILATTVCGFSLTAMAAGESFEVANMIHSDDFSDFMLDPGRIEVIGQPGVDVMPFEGNGQLEIERISTNAAVQSGIKYYFNDLKTGYENQLLAVEFTVEKSAADKELLMRVRNTNDSDSVAVGWLANGYISAYNGGSDGYVKTVAAPEAGPYKFTILMDTGLNKYSMWVNDQKLVELADFRVKNVAPSFLYLYMQNDNMFTTYLRDFKVYNPVMPAEEKAAYDMFALTKEDFITKSINNYVFADLNLPVAGEMYGSTITWTSSDTNVLSNAGVIGNITGETPVTLTATIDNNGIIKTKTFDLMLDIERDAVVLPTVTQDGYIVNDDFSDGIMDSRITSTLSTGGSLVEQNNRLELTRTDTASTTSDVAMYQFNSEKTNYMDGFLALEYTITKTEDKQVWIRSKSSTGGDVGRIVWEADGRLRVYTGNAYGYTTNRYANDPVKITMLMNCATGEYDVLIDNQKVAVNMAPRGTTKAVAYFDFYMQREHNHTVYLDDVKVYRPILPDYKAKELDSAALNTAQLTLQDPTKLTQNLNLPSQGANGSIIEWTSSNPSVISSDGVIHPENIVRSAPVTMTAKIRKGYETETKTFDFTAFVVQNENLLPTVDEAGYIVNDDFSDGSLDGRITSALATGGSLLEQNNRLELTRTATVTGSDRFVYNFNSEGTNYSDGYIALEYTITKTEDKQVWMRVRSSGASEIDVARVVWEGNGNLSFYTGNALGYTTKRFKNNPVKITMLLNCVTGVYDTFIDDKKVAVNLQPRTANKGAIGYFDVYMQNNNPSTVYVDDVKVYRPILPDYRAIDVDSAALTAARLTSEASANITQNLNLPLTGVNGSTIEWASSDPSVISNDGMVTTSDFAAPKSVTMTATIYKGYETVTKAFQFTVAGLELKLGDVVYTGTGVDETGALQAGDVNIAIPVTNPLNGFRSIMVVSTLYANNGQLVGADFESYDYGIVTDQDHIFQTSLTIPSDTENYYIKTLILSNWSTITPLKGSIQKGEKVAS